MNKHKKSTTDRSAAFKANNGSARGSIVLRTIKFRFVFVFMVLSVKAFAQVSLSYTSNFENSEGFVDGASLSGDWETTDTSVVITNDAAQFGSQSVRIPSADPENIISLGFNPPDNQILFVDYHTKLTASSLPDLPLLSTPETTAMLAVAPYGTGFGEWVFLDGDGNGNGTWHASGNPLSLDASGQTDWQQVTLRLDTQSGSWDVYINGTLSAVDLGFAETMLPEFAALNLYGNSSGPTYLDHISFLAANPLFTDLDLDGIDDAFENAYGLNALINDRNLDADADGLANIIEYASGLLPNQKDTDNDGLEDGWEVNRGYSASINEGLSGAFGDLEGDRLANQTEHDIGSSASTVDTTTTLAGTNTRTGGDLAITLIGRGAYTVNETAATSQLNH